MELNRISVKGEGRLPSQRLARRYALTAFLAHSAFVTVTLIPGIRAAPLVDGDSIHFLRVATNIVENRAISADRSPPYRWEALKPPGYPLLIASSIALAGHARWTLYLAACSAAVAAWAAVTLAVAWSGRHAAGHAAGLLVAFMPNSLGLSAMLLADAIFGHGMLLWCCLVYLAFHRGSAAALFGSGLTLTFLQVLRPQPLLLGWLLVLVAAVLLGRERTRLTFGSLLLLASLGVPGYLTLRTYREYGVATPAMITVSTARGYLHARYLAERDHVEFSTMRERVRREDLEEAAHLTTPEQSTGRVYLVAQRKLMEFIRDRPMDVARLMGAELSRQLIAPQEFAATVVLGRLPAPVRLLGVLATVLLWALACFGAFSLSDRRVASFVIVVCAFYLIAGSVSYFVGARLRFPADMAASPLMAIGAVCLNSRWGPRTCLTRLADRPTTIRQSSQ